MLSGPGAGGHCRRLVITAPGQWAKHPLSGLLPARTAGQSIQVPFPYYATFLSGAQDHTNRLIGDAMRQRGRPSGATDEGSVLQL